MEILDGPQLVDTPKPIRPAKKRIRKKAVIPTVTRTCQYEKCKRGPDGSRKVFETIRINGSNAAMFCSDYCRKKQWEYEHPRMAMHHGVRKIYRTIPMSEPIEAK